MRLIKLSAILIALTIGMAQEMKAANDWIDVTSEFIKNPGFDNNSATDWEWSSDARSQTIRSGCMEFWYGSFDIYQTLRGLPKGKYRLSVQAYYRPGANDSSYEAYLNATYEDDMTAELYASTSGNDYFQTILTSVYSYEFPQSVEGCWTYGNWWIGNVHYFPNTMESAANAFANGAYWNTLEFEAEGDIDIGLYNSESRNDNWCIFDNFKLEFQGNAVKVQSIVLSIEKNDVLIGESVQCTATITPDNALVKKLNWTSSNKNVATVDDNGLITAVGKGTATITAKATDGSNKSSAITVKVGSYQATENELVINEIMPSNIDEFVSPAFNFDGWMELYNPTDKTAQIDGLYLSDDETNLTKWRIPTIVGVLPAKGFLLIWFDSNDIAQQNATFKLDTDGGTIYISDASGKVITSQTYPASKERASYARTTDGGSTWSYAAVATPGATNMTSLFATDQLAAPVVDQPSQLFNGQLTINVTIPAGCTLRYTTDGSLPTADSERSYSGQFTISENTCYRFRLFANGFLPSSVTTRSYIYKDRDYYLPVVSVVSDEEFLYDDEIGVMVKGSGNGRPGNGQSAPCNWNMNWNRPVNFSYIDAEGEMVLNQDVDLEMCGGWSRAWYPHSFKLKGNKKMGGNKHLPYPFFTQKPYIRNRTLQIRNGGNDTNCRFKDAALAYIVQTSGVNIDVQGYQPIHEFINGQYIGVLNIREPNNKHYVYANYGWDDDEIDLFEMSPDSGYVQKCGTPDAYEELVDVLSPNAANSNTYEEICQQIDIDEFVNYMAIQFYYGGSDWPRNNVKAFRLRDGGKFRFVLFDVDAAFDYGTDVFNQFMQKETWTFDQLYPVELGRITDQIRMVTLFKNLLKNNTFRRKFIDAYCMVSGSIFEASRAQQILDQLYENVQPAMRLNGESAQSTYNNLRNKIGSRLSTATQALKNYSAFKLSSVDAQRVTLSSDTEGAQLLINGQQVPTGYFNGNLFAPVTLKAVAPAGYAFQGWKASGTEGTTVFNNGTRWSYYDQGSLDNEDWTSDTYNDSNWSQGDAPLGYGKDVVTTTVNANDANNQSKRQPTIYLRKTINLKQAPAANDEFMLSFTIDDGAIVYVNGEEAGRYNMPNGQVTYESYATHYAYDNPDVSTMQLDASLFRKGNNTIAIEVHNCDDHSSDILWDAALTMVSTTSGSYYSTDAEIQLPTGTVVLTASYRKLTEAERKQQNLSPVRINEISGSNNSLINEYGKKADWIELYNTTDKSIDVEGMYLTDNSDKPEKYQITKGQTRANTVIAPHSYLIVWCDKQETTDQGLHASFKIDGEGGLLQLMAADKSWTDILYYGPHDDKQTVGRYPDGTDDVYTMSLNTIEKPNIITSYMEKADQEELKHATGVKPVIASANGLRIYYGAGQLFVKSDEPQNADVLIFTADGKLVERQSVMIKNEKAKVNVAHLQAGLYLARAIGNNGQSVGCKFVK